jgi:hypothetical protein
MNYLIAVLVDRMEAEAAYTALEAKGLAMDRIAILGKGYQSADEYGFIDPNERGIRQAKLMAAWLIPFGFIGGSAFSLLTGLNTFAWAGEIGNHLVGGLLGAIGGTMGSIFIGGGSGIVFGSGDALSYRNRLNAGQYLIVVQGSEILLQQAANVLRTCNPENMQSYIDPYQKVSDSRKTPSL